MLVFQFSSVTQLCLTLCNPMDCSMPGFPVHHQLPEPTQTHVHIVGDAIQPSHPLLSASPSTFNLSRPASGSFPVDQFFASGGQRTGACFNISSSNEDSGLISFRMNWLDLLAVQGTLKSLLQNNSSKSLLGKLNLSKYVHKAGSTDKCLTYIGLKPFESWKSHFPRYSDMES